MQVIAKQGDTVDELCWRHLRQTRGVVERVLELNPGIAEHGVVLPHGLKVTLPEAATKQTNTAIVQLWD